MKVTSELHSAEDLHHPNDEWTETPIKVSQTTVDPSERTKSISHWSRRGASLFQSNRQRIWAVLGLLAIVIFPLSTADPLLLSLGITVGIYTVATIGLNVMIGYTGMISLAHSIFMGIGAFAAVGLGGILGLPIVLWLPGSFIIGGV